MKKSVFNMIFMIILTVLPMFVALYWIIVLIKDPNKNLPKRYLIFFLSLSVINYFAHAAYFNHDYNLYGFLENIWVFTSLAGYPLYYYYIRLLTRDRTIDWRWVWIVLPAALLSVFAFRLYFHMTPEELDTFIHGVLYKKKGYSLTGSKVIQLEILRDSIFKVVFVVQVVLSVYFGVRLITRFNQEVAEFYSDTSGENLTQVKWVLSAVVFASVISVTSSIIGKDYFLDKGWLIALPSLTHSLYLWFVGYVGALQSFTVSDFQKDVEDYEFRHAESIFKKPADFRGNLTAEDLSFMLEKEELFKDPGFKISDLAVKAATNRTYISRIINEEMGTNFRDWINSYRAEHAKLMLENEEFNDLPLIEVGEMSGFSSQSVFYRVFKEKFGEAPGNYRIAKQ